MKLFSLNIWFSELFQRERSQILIKYLLENNYDIIFLQEVTAPILAYIYQSIHEKYPLLFLEPGDHRPCLRRILLGLVELFPDFCAQLQELRLNGLLHVAQLLVLHRNDLLHLNHLRLRLEVEGALLLDLKLCCRLQVVMTFLRRCPDACQCRLNQRVRFNQAALDQLQYFCSLLRIKRCHG